MAVDVEGLQISSIAKTNSVAGVFFRGYNIKDHNIESPLGWKKELIILDKK
jgi:hypothetical protein